MLTKYILVVLLFVLFPYEARAAVLFSSQADNGVCGQNVATAEWDYTGSSEGVNARMSYQCDTPVPGRSNYYRITTYDLQHDAGNERGIDQINLTLGTTYYTGCWIRFDRINGVDIWHDTGAYPESYDKLWETRGNMRVIVAAGYPDWVETGTDHKFTFGLYLFEPYCSGCIYEQAQPNVSPYSRTSPYMADYERWYSIVIGFTPSNGSTENGRVRLWINGILTSDYQNIKTQDSGSPYISLFMHSTTMAQPSYDAPAHHRKYDNFVLSDSLEDMQSAGLMQDPESGTAPTRKLNNVTGVRVTLH